MLHWRFIKPSANIDQRMSDDISKTIESSDPSLTEKLAEKLGRRLRGGEVVELVGDLGSGKTTFVRGMARGVGSKDHVASPTFTISRVYKSDKLTLHHMDFYRLDKAGIMNLQIEELIADKANVVVIEWAEVTHEVLPSRRLLIRLKSKDEKTRNIELSYPKELSYLVEGLV